MIRIVAFKLVFQGLDITKERCMKKSLWHRLKRKFDKRELAQKIQSPFLRLLLFNPWFRLVIFCMFLTCIAVSICIPKIWTVSPPHFPTVIKISGLDFFQAWSLRRSAHKALIEKRITDAQHAFQAAVANNLADPSLHRELMNFYYQHDPANTNLNMAMTHALWLLKLTQTNVMDLELSSKIIEKYGFNDLLIDLLKARNDLTIPLDEIQLRALFNANMMEQFAQEWQKVGSLMTTNREIQLYQSAFLAGWGPAGTMNENRTLLEKASNDPQFRTLANRLLFKISIHQRDIDASAKYLKQLSAWRSDTAADHVKYWSLLTAAGKSTEAIKLAQEYPYPPNSAQETYSLALGYIELGLRDAASKLLQKYVPQYSYSAGMWILYANTLYSEKKWQELLGLALQLRQDPAAGVNLGGLSQFFEGQARLGLQQSAMAKEAFQNSSKHEFPDPSMALLVANSIVDYGFPQEAKALLVKFESKLSSNPYFWHLMLICSYQLQQESEVLSAAQKRYQLQSDDLNSVNNYAAALLLMREKPQEAIKLTLNLLELRPNSTSHMINHALALLINGRTPEATLVLDKINTNTLNQSEMSAFALAKFEAAYNSAQWEQSRQWAQKIAPQGLFPHQKTWLDKMLKQIPQK